MNPFWMWAALSAILFAGEILTTSFVLVFFAAAALIMAVAVAIMPMPNDVQLIVFGVLGLLGLAVGRKWIRARMAGSSAIAAGDRVRVMQTSGIKLMIERVGQ